MVGVFVIGLDWIVAQNGVLEILFVVLDPNEGQISLVQVADRDAVIGGENGRVAFGADAVGGVVGMAVDHRRVNAALLKQVEHAVDTLIEHAVRAHLYTDESLGGGRRTPAAALLKSRRRRRAECQRAQSLQDFSPTDGPLRWLAGASLVRT